MSEKVAAVVVTYNRKELLIECLEAIRNQTHKLDTIFIIDNRSTDGTPEFLLAKSYIPKLPDASIAENQLIQNRIPFLNSPSENIDINYLRKSENDGGAGGFYEGMKQAYEAGYHWLWLMDDDGLPSLNCLENLLRYGKIGIIDYIAPNIIDEHGLSIFSDKFSQSNIATIQYYGGPFNGILLSKYLLEKIGLPIKEFFIWGDEMEYRNRIIENGFITVTIKEAEHFHRRTGFNYKKVPRVYYFSRNLVFCAKLFKGVYRSKIIHLLGVTKTLLKIIGFAIIALNLKQLKNSLKGIYHGYKTNIQDYQIKAINTFNKS